jgi:hypothetical protein
VVNIILEGNQTMEFNDTLLSVEGRIVVRDNATLKLDNVKVRFIESELRHGVHVSGNGKLIIGNSDIKYKIRLNESAGLYALNSSLYYSDYCMVHEYNHTHGGLDAIGTATVELEQTKIGDLRTYGDAEVLVEDCDIYRTVSNKGRLEVVNSVVRIHWRTFQDSVLDINIPNLTRYTGSMLFLPPVDTAFLNTTIEKIWLGVYNTSITISDSRVDLVSVYGRSDVTLRNCEIDYLNTMNAEGEFIAYDSQLGNIRFYSSNYSIAIETCIIENLEMDGARSFLNVPGCRIGSLTMDKVFRGEQSSYLRDTVIGEFRPSLGEEYPTEFYMDNVTITDGFWFNYGGGETSKGLKIYGDMEISPGASMKRTIINGYTIVNRFYPVFITDNDTPVANVTVNIRTGNKTRMVGMTDINGYIEVPVRYEDINALVRPPAKPYLINEMNMTGTVDLVWEIDGVENEMEISLRTKTPIIIETDTGGLDSLIVPVIIILVFAFIYRESRV